MKKVSSQSKQTSGQILVEYVIMLAIVTFIVLACIVLFSTFSDYGFNVRKQVGIDSP